MTVSITPGAFNVQVLQAAEVFKTSSNEALYFVILIKQKVNRVNFVQFRMQPRALSFRFFIRVRPLQKHAKGVHAGSRAFAERALDRPQIH
jgi:hypothetical protein